MKNFKEKILKLGKKRYCFISLLLAFLLGFSVLTALNGSKSGKTEVNALSSPAYKNLDLNGERFSYQTSLNELKNSYNIFKTRFTNYYFGFEENSEGVVTLYFDAFSKSTDDSNKDTRQDALNKLFTFYDNEKNVVNNNFVFTAYNEFDNDNISLNTNTTALNVNFNEFVNYFNLSQEYLNKDLILQFIYLKDNFPQSEESNMDYIRNNSIIYSYYLGSQINYTFNIPKFDGYNLTNIGCWMGSDTFNDDNMIISESFSTVRNSSLSSNTSGQLLIDELKFIENNETNVLRFKTIFIYDDSKPYFKGNILLSEYKVDNAFLAKIRSSANININQNIGGAIFGGNFPDNKVIDNITYHLSFIDPSINLFIFTYETGNNWKNSLFVYPRQNIVQPNNKKVLYARQNRLMYLSSSSDLKVTYDGLTYNALSEQVDDILYNVNYEGNIEEIEFNQRVKEDFIQFAKTTGLGSLIGLIIGFLLGNPLYGLLIGGGIGAAIGIIPLILDAIQKALGGTIFEPLISGIYGVFDAIAKIFAGIVDLLFEFLLNIITNPLVLILVAIFVLLYVFYFRKK